MIVYHIYKIVNNVNNLVYIGCTTRSVDERFKEHLTSNKQDDFHKAIAVFGREQFSVVTLESGVDLTIRFDREKYYIALYKANEIEYGYNRTIGGRGTIGYEFTEEARHKISQAEIGRLHKQETKDKIAQSHMGKPLSEEHKLSVSRGRLGKYKGTENAFYGKHHTDESKRKAVETKKALGLLRAVRGVNLKTNEQIEFESLSDAARYIVSIRGGVLKTVLAHIANSIVGKCFAKSAYGYKWVYKEPSNDYLDREYSQCETH